MKTLTHPVAPEDVMALIDGELTTAEATLVSQHIEECTDCAAIRDQFRNTSQALSEWKVPPAPPAADQAIEARLATRANERGSSRMRTGLTFRNWRVWAVGGGGAVFGAFGLLAFVVLSFNYGVKERHLMGYVQPDAKAQQSVMAGALSSANVSTYAYKNDGKTSAPLIARTASLTVSVKNLDVARGGLDAILARHHGYSAKLEILEETPPRGLTDSVRIPIAELDAAMAEMRALGSVGKESQSGEEVTQQHTDLAARLTNARETETRLRDILAHQTGKMKDVLAVEEKISETRGEIEQLEAEQKNLEHRVEFASVDLELVEQYKAQLGSASDSIPNQMHNSFVAGLCHAGGSLLGLVLFLEEYGPVLAVWLVLLGVPGTLLWRRYLKVRNGIGS